MNKKVYEYNRKKQLRRLLGIVAANRWPKDYIAYIGVAQVVDHDKANIIAHEELEKRIKGKGMQVLDLGLLF